MADARASVGASLYVYIVVGAGWGAAPFSEGVAVAIETDPVPGDLVPRWSSQPVDGIARDAWRAGTVPPRAAHRPRTGASAGRGLRSSCADGIRPGCASVGRPGVERERARDATCGRSGSGESGHSPPAKELKDVDARPIIVILAVLAAAGLGAGGGVVVGPVGTSAPRARAPAADTSASRCAEPDSRRFDFWLGRWTVRDTAGAEVGRSEITAVSGGCAILERWSGGDGVDGTSLNVYEPASGRWTQLWVGGGGLILHLTGGWRDGAMVLSDRRRTAAGKEVRDRIRWTPLEGGRVRQTWEVSADGGATWRTAFDGLYVPR